MIGRWSLWHRTQQAGVNVQRWLLQRLGGGDGDRAMYHFSFVDSEGRQTLYYCSYYPVDEGAVGRCLVYSILSHRGLCAVVCRLFKQRLTQPFFLFILPSGSSGSILLSRDFPSHVLTVFKLIHAPVSNDQILVIASHG